MKSSTTLATIRVAFVTAIVCWSISVAAAVEAGDAAVAVRFSDQTAGPFEPEWFEEEFSTMPPGEDLAADSAIGVPARGLCPHCHGISRAPGHPAKPRRQMPGDVDRGDHPPLRYQMCDCQRAGSPHRVAKWAQPAIGKHYSAWFVGGGAAFGGRGRCSHEGTWGLDYDGWLKPRRVWLNWTGGRYQGGEGAYQTEGRTKLLNHH